MEVAREAGLDVRRFRVDLQSNAIVEAFGADLEETRAPPTGRERGGVKEAQGGERLVFPRGSRATPERHLRLRRCALRGMARGRARRRGRGPPRSRARTRSPRCAASGGMATVEVEAVCDLSNQAAEAELWRLAAEGRVRPLRVLTETLWEPA